MGVTKKIVSAISSHGSKRISYLNRSIFRTICNVLPLFWFRSAKRDLNLFNFYVLAILFSERDIDPTDSKQTNQFVLFKFTDIQQGD